MIPTPIPPPVQAAAPDIANRVALILTNLAALVAARLPRSPREVLTAALWSYLNRTVRRFGRLMARVAADRLSAPRPPRPSRPTSDRPTSDCPTADRPTTPHSTTGLPWPTRLPAGHLWLVRAIPNEAAALASQLEALLAEPGVADLLAACPAAARMLRPIGRMLGVEALARKPSPRKRPAAPPREAKPPAPKPPPADPDYRPSAKWPKAHWPRPSWPPADPALAKPG